MSLIVCILYMISKKEHEVKKGMIFAGCSFTWGQGLWFYSNLETLINPENKWGYSPGLVNHAHFKFMEANRFSRIVSDFLGSYELVHYKNGGANDQIVRYWKRCLEAEFTERIESFHPGEDDLVDPISFDEVSHIVFQLTQSSRDKFYYSVDGEFFNDPLQWNFAVEHKKNYHSFKKYVETNNLQVYDINQGHMISSIEGVKSFLQLCESRGIKAMILTWPNEFLEYIKNDNWLRDRWIKINHDGEEYESIQGLLEKNPHLQICEDFKNFEIPPNDCHPTLEVHRKIALSIINFIKK